MRAPPPLQKKSNLLRFVHVFFFFFLVLISLIRRNWESVEVVEREERGEREESSNGVKFLGVLWFSRHIEPRTIYVITQRPRRYLHVHTIHIRFRINSYPSPFPCLLSFHYYNNRPQNLQLANILYPLVKVLGEECKDNDGSRHA